MSETITVHPLTQNPTKAWEEISKTQRVIKIAYKAPKTENKDPNKFARIVVMSDTHALTRHLKFDIPDGDIFIHAGDFTACGSEEEVKEFNEFLGQLPHEHKLVIAGNHELSFDPSFTHPLSRNRGHHQGLFDEIPLLGHKKEKLEQSVMSENIRQHLTNCTYLEDSGVEIYGIKFYGTPWQPEVIIGIFFKKPQSHADEFSLFSSAAGPLTYVEAKKSSKNGISYQKTQMCSSRTHRRWVSMISAAVECERAVLSFYQRYRNV